MFGTNREPNDSRYHCVPIKGPLKHPRTSEIYGTERLKGAFNGTPLKGESVVTQKANDINSSSNYFAQEDFHYTASLLTVFFGIKRLVNFTVNYEQPVHLAVKL